jgi:hypothetical protein
MIRTFRRSMEHHKPTKTGQHIVQAGKGGHTQGRHLSGTQLANFLDRIQGFDNRTGG